jgi:hypothetical protein
VRGRYRLVGLSPQGEALDLTGAVQRLEREEAPNTLAERLVVELPDVSGELAGRLPLGGRLFLFADEGAGEFECNRYLVVRHAARDAGERTLELGCFDPSFFLMRSQGDAFYRAGTSAAAVIEDIAGEWNVPLGPLPEGLGVPLGKQVLRGRSIADMLRGVLAEVADVAGVRFHLQWRVDRLVVRREAGNSPVPWLRGDVVAEVVDERDMEDLVTRVLVVGNAPDGARAPVVAQVDGLTEFGVLQELVTAPQNDSDGKAVAAAARVLRERGVPRQVRRVVAPDMPSLRRGDGVRVSVGSLEGWFLVNGIERDVVEGTMTLGLRTPGEGLELYRNPTTEAGEERKAGGGGGIVITEDEVYNPGGAG